MKNIQQTGQSTATALAPKSLEDLAREAAAEIEAELTDGSAVNQLARELWGPLKAFMRNKGWGLEDPDRAASEALSLILASLDRYDRDRAPLMSWAWGVASNHLRSLLRTTSQARENRPASKYEEHHADRYHLAVVTPGQRLTMLAEILQLPVEDYQVLCDLFIEKKDATEVGRLHGLSAAAVRQRKKRLTARLHTCTCPVPPA
ncbi:hypothetical protein GALL_310690 [mine drainage metagenome]|uniref:Uncharacterized protein n=1 Tax=mine drainage metagenome TaxID=410659 RepID=A0A1J5R4V4_9ZZZZ